MKCAGIPCNKRDIDPTVSDLKKQLAATRNLSDDDSSIDSGAACSSSQTDIRSFFTAKQQKAESIPDFMEIPDFAGAGAPHATTVTWEGLTAVGGGQVGMGGKVRGHQAAIEMKRLAKAGANVKAKAIHRFKAKAKAKWPTKVKTKSSTTIKPVTKSKSKPKTVKQTLAKRSAKANQKR